MILVDSSVWLEHLMGRSSRIRSKARLWTHDRALAREAHRLGVAA